MTSKVMWHLESQCPCEAQSGRPASHDPEEQQAIVMRKLGRMLKKDGFKRIGLDGLRTQNS